CMQGIKYPYSF
nr:immunoglobulin light chain junction region [Macaca mulatta]MOV62549.1 immunoglobulin light chain junction region [Macaca mulatta]MOV64687.1 immunoglobulin light chain junction region [Macaca mulatta]MOV65354.1 immunoglobulin light chain junction region [Macaca mulatta]